MGLRDIITGKRYPSHQFPEPPPPRPPPKPRVPKARRPAELDAWQPGKTREVAHVSELLRQMYELDVTIWAMRNLSNERDLRRARDLRAESNELFTEIRRTVAEWDDGRAWKDWTDAELAEITQIRQIVYSYPAKRHEKGY
ncbi:hypothetical protein OQA88_8886 [Cercophora sp. LCS_1]